MMPQKIDRPKMRETLESAVKNTHAQYPNFQGVIIFGSFVNDKEKSSDIDLIPVLKTYNGCWYFRPICEGENEFEEDYYGYEKMQKAFGEYFKDSVSGNRHVFKTMRNMKGLIHIGAGLVALDDMKYLKEKLEHHGARPENFIGTEEAARAINKFYRKPADTKAREARGE